MTEISKEYAEALFSLACEEGEEQEVLSALESTQRAFEKNPELMELLSSPGISLSERVDTIEQIFLGTMPEDVLSFLQLLCEKRRIRLFPDCVKEYRRLLNQRNAVVTAKVTSAVTLTDAECATLKQRLEKISGNTVLLDCTVDPAILGGVVVELNGTVMDGSLRHRLREVKEVMNR
ncbi:MAG: ATP synthase F1 subunit delta [Clostridia bacterium]|nr:ATP synthase F1 subunit delta [Clostridia bacterium]